MKILLDYVFPITVITPTPAASTGFLKRAALVCKPAMGQEANIGELYACSNMTAVGVRVNPEGPSYDEAQQLFDAGLSQVFILLANDLDLADYLETHKGEFYTLLVSSDFDDDDITQDITTPAVAASKVMGDLTFTAKIAGVLGNDITVEYVDEADAGEEIARAVDKAITVSIKDGVSTAEMIKAAIDDSVSASALITVTIATDEDETPQAVDDCQLENGAHAVMTDGTGITLGTFDGVVGVSSDDEEVCADQVTYLNRCAFFTANGAQNMCYAFGSLLANASNWLNQQYITMPLNDGVAELGDANALFDAKVSFVLHDDEFGNRLALFSVQGKAIVAPYILKNLRIDMQSRALQWISLNQPQYTIKEASLLETRLQEDVINSYIALGRIESGSIEITLVNANFVANGEISVPQPKALWRVFSEMRETV